MRATLYDQSVEPKANSNKYSLKFLLKEPKEGESLRQANDSNVYNGILYHYLFDLCATDNYA